MGTPRASERLQQVRGPGRAAAGCPGGAPDTPAARPALPHPGRRGRAATPPARRIKFVGSRRGGAARRGGETLSPGRALGVAHRAPGHPRAGPRVAAASGPPAPPPPPPPRFPFIFASLSPSLPSLSLSLSLSSSPSHSRALLALALFRSLAPSFPFPSPSPPDAISPSFPGSSSLPPALRHEGMWK